MEKLLFGPDTPLVNSSRDATQSSNAAIPDPMKPAPAAESGSRAGSDNDWAKGMVRSMLASGRLPVGADRFSIATGDNWFKTLLRGAKDDGRDAWERLVANSVAPIYKGRRSPLQESEFLQEFTLQLIAGVKPASALQLARAKDPGGDWHAQWVLGNGPEMLAEAFLDQ